MSRAIGRPKPAADHVPEEIEQNVVEAPVVEPELLEQLEAVE